MTQTNTITINPLPSKTWNWLKMNASTVELREPEQGAQTEFAPAGALTFQDIAGNWPDVETGMGSDLDRFLEPIPGTLVDLAAGETMASPALAVFRFAPGATRGSRLLIHAGAGSTLALAVLCGSSAPGAGAAALQIKIKADANATVRLYLLQTLDDAATGLIDVGAVCGEGAAFELTRMELGAGRLYAGCLADLAGKGSGFTAQVGYFARAGQRLDMNYVARHRGKRTTCRMDSTGVLAGDAFKLFRGSIDFLPGCAGAKGEEQEDVLLLGEEVTNQTIPLILCGEEDVEGNHGATIGRLDERMLFYLASRGIPAQQARRLLAHARVDALAQRLPQALAEEARHFMEEHGNEL